MATKQSSAQSTALTVVSPSDYEIVKAADGLAGYLAEALAPGETINPGDLPQIKVPHGGGTSWELPTGEVSKSLDCIVLLRQKPRAYWEKEAGEEASPPDCQSPDGTRGYGLYGGDHFSPDGGEILNPGGLCAKCPMDKWGSKDDEGGAKACRQRTHLSLLLPTAYLPVTLLLSPTSFLRAKQYCLGLGAYYKVVTRIALVASGSGQRQFNTVSFHNMQPYMQPLGPDALAKIVAYRKVMLPFLKLQPPAGSRPEDLAPVEEA